MIIRARVIVTMDGPPIENGAIAVSGNRIIDVGKFPEISARHSGQQLVDLGEQVMLPGLINAHCHLDYTCLRGQIPPKKSFADWIRSINAEKAKLSAQDYLASITEGFAEAKRFGTTTIANLTAFPELIPQIASPIRTWWFAELIDVRSPERANELVDRAISALKRTKDSSGGIGLAPHAPFTASTNLYRRCEEIAQRENILLTTHLAESREEMSMFRDGAGPLYDFMRTNGRPMDDCGHDTSFAFFVNASGAPGGRALAAGWIVAHLNELAKRDFELLETFSGKFHVVHSPRSHDYFAHSAFAFERLRDLGFNICLGTDSLASNENLSLFAEIRAFRHGEPAVSPKEALEMVTVHGGRALGRPQTIGRIRANYFADLIAIPCSGITDVFEEIGAFDRPVDWMMVNGRM
ncbi:MAG TPA: amidohydrolase family protein [Candidatus Udaeobacter sp.]